MKTYNLLSAALFISSLLIYGTAIGMHDGGPCEVYIGGRRVDMYELSVEQTNYLAETKALLQADNNTYDPEPTNINAPLDEAHVMNPYWRKIATQDQPTKDNELKKIMKMLFTDFGYPLKRYHIAAAVLAGAHPHQKALGSFPIEDAVLKQDEPLCALLLEKGALPNAQCYIITTPLFACESKRLAELFLSHKADMKLKDHNGTTYLHQVQRSRRYEVFLIKLCREHGLSSFDRDSFGATPLHELALNAYVHEKEDLQKKVSALFEGLTSQEMHQLIELRHVNRGTVFDILNDYKQNSKAQFLQNLLQSYLDNKP